MISDTTFRYTVTVRTSIRGVPSSARLTTSSCSVSASSSRFLSICATLTHGCSTCFRMWVRISSSPGGASSSTLASACCDVRCSCRCTAMALGSTLCDLSTRNEWKFFTSSEVQFSHIQQRTGAVPRLESWGASSLSTSDMTWRASPFAPPKGLRG